MKIALVAKRYWPARGGVESHVRLLAQELSRHSQVTVITQRIDEAPATRLSDGLLPPSPFTPFRDGDVDVVPLRPGLWRRVLLLPLAIQVIPGLRRYSHGRLRRLTAAIYARVVGPLITRLAGPVDLIHTFGGNHLAAAVVQAGRSSGAPVVNTPAAHPGQWDDDPASAAAYRRTDVVIGLLEADARVYRSLGVHSEAVRVCGPCVADHWSEAGDALRARAVPSGHLVVFLGARRSYKGADVALAAAKRVSERRDDVWFAFIGPGPPLQSDGLPRIIDVGAVDETTKAAWLTAADVLCLPSAAESFGIVVIEAFSARTSAVVSDIPPLRELVQASGVGHSVPRTEAAVAEALIASFADGAWLAEDAERARDFWKHRYEPSAVAAWHRQLYEELVCTRSPA